MGKTTNPVVKWALIGSVGFLLARWHMPPTVRGLIALSSGMRLAVILWLVFAIYWSIAAKDKGRSRNSESFWSRQVHLVLVNVAALLLLLRVPGLTARFLPASVVVSVFGLSIDACSLLLAVWARRHLGSNWSGEVRIAENHQLVRSGPYRMLRHPIYTAALGMYFGTAIVSGEVHSLLALILVILAYWRKIHLEELVLGDALGAEYEHYRRHTSALLPWLL
jgi:protein-S-isoprenylcysteine O-methyltransferase Ste14